MCEYNYGRKIYQACGHYGPVHCLSWEPCKDATYRCHGYIPCSNKKENPGQTTSTEDGPCSDCKLLFTHTEQGWVKKSAGSNKK